MLVPSRSPRTSAQNTGAGPSGASAPVGRRIVVRTARLLTAVAGVYGRTQMTPASECDLGIQLHLEIPARCA
jgi:hypothetical protein